MGAGVCFGKAGPRQHGTVPASRLCLQKAGWKAEELDLMEIDKAFAAQVCAAHKVMGWATSRIDVDGGAIGHPVGACGCRILSMSMHEMIRHSAHKGVAPLCIGGGIGVAVAVER